MHNYFIKIFDPVYYLGCVPTEEELNEFTSIVENQNEPNTVDINVFVPHMEKQIRAFKYISLLLFESLFILTNIFEIHNIIIYEQSIKIKKNH